MTQNSQRSIAWIAYFAAAASILIAAVWVIPSKAASTLTVCPAGCDFPTVTAAVTAASPGDTINIGAGSYPGNLIISKDRLKLVGAGVSQVYVTADAPGIVLNLEADNLYIEGMTIQGDTSSTSGLQARGVKNLSLIDLTVKDVLNSVILLEGTKNTQLTRIGAYSSQNGNGISITDSSNITLTGISTSGNYSGGIGLFSLRENYTIALSGITLAGTNSIQESNPLYVKLGNYLDPTNPYPIIGFTQTDFDFTVRNPLDTPYTTWYQKSPASALLWVDQQNSIMPIFKSNALIQSLVDGTYYVFMDMRIQAAIQDAQPGNTIEVAPGTYHENILINKWVKISGSGKGEDPENDTILQKQTDTAVVKIEASGLSTSEPLLINDLRIHPVNVAGIEISTGNLSFITLDQISVVGTNESNDTESEIGLKVSPIASINNLVVNESSFDHLTYGWYFAKHGDWGPGGSNASFISVTGSTFNFNDAKGLYLEKLSDATFTNVEIIGNGQNTAFWNAAWNAGLDINLKGQETYQNLSFNNLTVKDNGLGVREGAGIMIKARTDGPTYSLYPATLSNVSINGGVFENNERGVVIGQPGASNSSPTTVTLNDSTLQNNVPSYTGVDGSVYGALVNHTTLQIDAANNYWGTLSWAGYSGQTAFPESIFGDAVWEPWSNAEHNQTYFIPETTYTDIQDVSASEGDNGSSGGIFGYDAFFNIGDAVANVQVDGSVYVSSGHYLEEIVLPESKGAISLHGSGADFTTLEGLPEGYSSTLQIAAPGAEVQGLSIESGESGNLVGVTLQPSAVGATFQKNQISGFQTGILLSSGIENAAVLENLITGNANGILVVGSSNGLLVKNNEFVDNDRIDPSWIGKENAGLRIMDTYNGEGNTFTENSMSGSILGVDNNSIYSIDAQRNYWGSPSGPSVAENVGGEGTPLFGSVDFAPWLCCGSDTSPEVGFQPAADAEGCTNFPSRLVFSTQPGDAFITFPFDPTPVIRIEDDLGNRAVNFNENVSIEFGNNPSAAYLFPSSTVTAINGAVTLNGFYIDKAGEGYDLVASVDSLGSVTSTAFNVYEPQVDLSVEISASTPTLTGGQQLSYIIHTNNNGPQPARNTVVTITLPNGFVYQNAQGDGWICENNQQVVSCSQSLLAINSISTIEVSVSAPSTTSVFTALAAVSNDFTDLDPSNNQASVDVEVLPPPTRYLFLPTVIR